MPDENKHYTRATALLDYENPSLVRRRENLLSIMSLNSPKPVNVSQKNSAKRTREIIKALYGYVSALPLGYNKNDDVSASKVEKDGYGQCNTKVTLLCALARGAGVPTRLRAYRISKDAQRGRAPNWLVGFAPKTTIFFWPEFLIENKWLALQQVVHTKKREWNSCPFDGARYQLEPLRREWIARDLGIWASPDEFFKKHKPSVNGWRKIGWIVIGRRVMNKVAKNPGC